VLAIRKGKKGDKIVALDAHLDTVFPEGTDVKVKMRGDTNAWLSDAIAGVTSDE